MLKLIPLIYIPYSCQIMTRINKHSTNQGLKHVPKDLRDLNLLQSGRLSLIEEHEALLVLLVATLTTLGGGGMFGLSLLECCSHISMSKKESLNKNRKY